MARLLVISYGIGGRLTAEMFSNETHGFTKLRKDTAETVGCFFEEWITFLFHTGCSIFSF